MRKNFLCLVALLLLVFIAGNDAFAGGAAVTDRTWDGGGNTNNWSTKNNWVGNKAVSSGAGVIFAGSIRTTANNDRTGYTHRLITFNSGASPFTLTGNTLTLTGNVTNNSTNLQTINLGLATTAVRIFNASSGDLLIGGVISGTGGGITKTGNNRLTLTGANTYSGATTINGGMLVIGAPGVIPNGSPVILTLGTLSSGEGSGNSETMGTLQLTGNATIAMGSGTHSLTFSASSGVSWSPGVFLLITGWTGSYNSQSGSSGRIFVGGSAGGLSGSQLSQILFFDGTYYYTATQITGGEVVPTSNKVLTFSTSRYAVASGDWDKTTTWAYSSGGAAGATVPDAGTDVFIGESATGRTVTVPNGYAAAAKSLSLGSLNPNANSLTLGNSSSSLTVAENLTITKAASGTATNSLNVNTGSASISGSATLAGSSTSSNTIAQIVVSTGTLTIGQNLTFAAGTTSNNKLTVSGAGTVNLGGALSGTGAFTGPTSTFNFNGTVPQTIPALNYFNLQVNNTSPAGATLSTAITSSNVGGDITIGDAGGQSLLNTSSYNISLATGKSLTIATDATLDAGTGIISNAAVIIDGTFRTANANGFNGSVTTAVSTTGTSINLGSLSTVEYFANGNQTVTDAPYKYLTLSGSGIKTAANAITVIGETLIQGVTFRSGASAGFSSNLGILDIDGNAGITLGTGNHTLTFADSHLNDWSGTTLTINGWAGNWDGTSGSAGKIYFGSSNTTLTSTQISLIQFFKGSSNYSARILNTGEVVPVAGYTWIGTTSTNWHVGSNWQCGSVPSATSDVIIPSGTPNQPTISADATCRDITINTGAALTISGTNTLSISGNWTNNGTYNFNQSTLAFTGSTQALAGTSQEFFNIALTGSSITSIPNLSFIYGSLSLSGTAQALITGNGSFANALILGGIPVTRNSWGGSGSAAVHKSAQWFGTSTGILNNTAGASAGDWTGSSGTNWNDTGNWYGGVVPTTATDANIPAVANLPIIDGTAAVCKSLKIQAGASLTINSGSLTVGGDLTLYSTASNLSASLINRASLTVTGTTKVQQYMTGNQWHLISSPVANQAINQTFISTNAIATNGTNGTIWALADYDQANNRWNNYFTASTGGNLVPGKGYELRPSVSGPVTFTGTPGTEVMGYSISRAATGLRGWNCVGNPFMSAIRITDGTGGLKNNNFIGLNYGELDPNYAAVYLWIEGAGYSYEGTQVSYYQAISNTGFVTPQYNPPATPYSNYLTGENNFVQIGQAFFVKSNFNGGSLQFTTAMQEHMRTTEFKSGHESWPGIRMVAHSGKAIGLTDVTFHEGMTPGLDPTYDAGLLRSGANLEFYSRLVEDNGIDFSLQCLPDYRSGDLIIPLGLDYAVGGSVTFSAEPVNMPHGSLMLVDRETGIRTPMDEKGSSYTTTVPQGQKGTGRFYLYSFASSSGIDNPTAPDLIVYNHGCDVHILGTIGTNARATLFTLLGQQSGIYRLRQGDLNILHLNQAAKGLYLLRIEDGNKIITRKLELN